MVEEERIISIPLEMITENGVPFVIRRNSPKRFKIKLETFCGPLKEYFTMDTDAVFDTDTPKLFAFNFPEHKDTASDAVFDDGHRGTTKEMKISIRNSNNIEVSYSDIIALSGDWYETFDDLFKADDVDLIMEKHDILSDTFHVIKAQLFQKVTKMDRASYRYGSLAATNFNHFRAPQIIGTSISLTPEGDAVESYKEYHSRAISAAQGEYQLGPLKKAYAINAFADHFLTDMFSTGHMRVPRRALHSIKGIKDNFTARTMHDEDSSNGLWVWSRKKAVPWKAFGDNLLKHVENPARDTEEDPDTKKKESKHFRQVKAAVVASVYEVTEAFRNPWFPQEENLALELVPIPYPPGVPILTNLTPANYYMQLVPLKGTHRFDLKTGQLAVNGNPGVDATLKKETNGYPMFTLDKSNKVLQREGDAKSNSYYYL